MKTVLRLASLIAIVIFGLSAVGPVSAENNWAVGNLVGLCANTKIYYGPANSYGWHTNVPENNWTVKVIGGPLSADGETWWDTSRYAAGDPSGGTGWVKQREADCGSGGGGGGGGGGLPPSPTPYPIPTPYQDSGAPCESTAEPEQFGPFWNLEHAIVLTIPSGDVQRDMKVQTTLPDLNQDAIDLGVEPVADWAIYSYAEVENSDSQPPLETNKEWRILIPGRLVDYKFLDKDYGAYRDKWLNQPGDMVYLMCKNQITPTSSDQLLPVLRGLAIVSPTPGAQLSYQVEIPSWMSWIQTDLRIGSNAIITLIAPDGTVYSPTSSAVTYTATPSFAVHTLNLDTPQGGIWQVVVDVISAESDSVFMLNVNGKQYNNPSNDNIPPVTGMHFDGTKGKNGWFTSNVTVTLSAEDNPDGSGVQGIEWSIDNGDTWQEYVGPFVVSQEGLSYVLGRSYDNEGNYETSPIGKFLSIDKTPPVVNVSIDQPEYTRVEPFVVHYSAFDPEPGSGLAALTGLFNNQPVTDGQTVDLFWLSLGQYTLTATGEDYAGWVTTDSETIQLIATIPSLQQTVSRLCTEKYITKQGICTSLQQKLESALAAQQRDQKKTAVNILLAFQNELKAQKGKAVQLQAYELLMMDSNYVITALGGKK